MHISIYCKHVHKILRTFCFFILSRSGFGLFLHDLKLDSSYILTPSTRVYTRVCATLGDAEDQCCAAQMCYRIGVANSRALIRDEASPLGFVMDRAQFNPIKLNYANC